MLSSHAGGMKDLCSLLLKVLFTYFNMCFTHFLTDRVGKYPFMITAT